MAIDKLNITLKNYAEFTGTIPADQGPVLANMTTTAVVAHYNAGVELEYMLAWKEASEEYEAAA